MIRNFTRLMAALFAAAAMIALSVPAQAQAPFYSCVVTMTSAGVSNIGGAGYCPIDPQRMTNGAGVSLLLNFSSGASATATVQLTGDVPVNTAGGGIWNNHDTLVSETANANGNLQFPVTGVRLNVTSYTSGTVTLTVIQPALPKS